MFEYLSPIGQMYIFLDKNVNRYALMINDIIYGHYPNAISAADDVYCHATGCYDWDVLDGQVSNAPTDLFEWKKLR